MRRVLSIGLLGLAALASSAAQAQDDEHEPWGIAVYDADENFITSKWPDEDEVSIGSREDQDIVLDGLEPRHVTVRRAGNGEELVVSPVDGVAQVGDEVQTESFFFYPNVPLVLGEYRVQFFLPSEDDAPTPEGFTETEEEEAVDGAPAVEPDLAASTASAARAAEFASEAYRFCHDESFGEKGVVGVDFCAILDEDSIAVCPQAARCKEWKAPKGGVGWTFGQVGKKGSSGRARRVAKREPLFELPEVPPIVGYLILGAVVFALVVVFVQTVRKAGWEDEDYDFDLPEISEEARKLQTLPEARSQVLLRMAERALEELGDPAEAAILVHLAVLRHLDDEGLVRYHPSKTNGDYLRRIRRYAELATLFKNVVRETERLRFGDGQVDVASVRQSLADARRVLPKHTAAATSGPGGAAGLLALVALSAAASACGEAPGTQAYYNHGPAGMSALPGLLRATGLEVTIRQDRLIDLPPDTSVVVIRTSAVGKQPWPSELRVDRLLDASRAVVVIDDFGKSDFFLPSTASVSASRDGPRAVDLAIPVNPDVVSCAFVFDGLDERYAEDPLRVPMGRRILYDGTSETSTVSEHPLVLYPLLTYRDFPEAKGRTAAYGWAVHRVDLDREPLPGCLYVFADRDLFTNAALTRPANASFAARFFATLTSEGGQVVFADRLNQWTASEADGSASEDQDPEADPTRALEASNMMPFLLQALATLALFYFFVGAAFGPLRDRFTKEHKAFVEHVEAIGRQYARTGQPGLTHSATALSRLLVMRYRDKLRGGEGGGWGALATELATKHGLDERNVRAALRLGIEGKSELGAPGPEDPPPSSPQMLETLSRLLNARHRELTGQTKARRTYRD